MATLVLTAVGAALGGPIGAAIGAAVGQQIDQNILFAPKGREGPRLKDLAVQTSQYGTQFPRIYGRMRVAGTVIWATDLIENKSREGGGKGRPSVTRYSYSVSLAVALSSRPIQAIGRIWADGNILRGTGGDFAVQTGFRLYNGYGDQPVDPLLASAEGAGLCPAYRGIAYAVFEGLPLEEYGNRIPSLTFEILADDGAVSLETVAGDLMLLDPLSVLSSPLNGTALSGDDRGAALAALAEGYPLSLGPGFGGLRVTLHESDDDTELPVIESALFVPDPELDGAARLRRREAGSRSAQALALRYYDPARDYQAGLRRGQSVGAVRERTIDLPVVLDAGVAQQRADILAGLGRLRGDQIELRCAIADRAMLPGQRIRLAGTDGAWRVERWAMTGSRIEMTLVRHGLPGARVLPDVEAGRAISAPDVALVETHFALFDLPSAYDSPATAPRVALALSGEGTGWRGAAILSSDGFGNPGPVIEQIRTPAISGHVLVAPGPGSALLVDQRNVCEIVLSDPGQQLQNADFEALARGANLAMIGGELLQFGHAEPLGDGHYRLGRLWRGRGGTEDRMGDHVAGESFVLIDSELPLLDPASLPGGGALALFALGIGDSEPVSASMESFGRALLPLSPVHPGCRWASDDSLDICWTRRSRGGFAWRDSVDIPLAEEQEQYRLIISGASGQLLDAMLDEPSYNLDAAIIDSARTAGDDELEIAIRQLGQHGASPPRIIHVDIAA
ncbi:MAG: phage tail protein [Blastomonas sp.]